MTTFYAMVFLVLTANGPSLSGNAFITNPLFTTEEACLERVAKINIAVAEAGKNRDGKVALVCAMALDPTEGSE